jgi:MFS family permease
VRSRNAALRTWLTLLFFALALGPALGGTVHGFFLDETSWGYRFLWPATLISIGLAALAVWAVGGHLVLRSRACKVLIWTATLEFLAYSAVILVGSQKFIVAIVNYAPATLFLLICLVLVYLHSHRWQILCGVIGLVLTFVAAGVQVLKIAIHPIYLNHNAFYHLIQFVGLALIFIAGRDLLDFKGVIHEKS